MAKKRKLFLKLYPSYLLITVGSLLAVCWYFTQSSKSFFISQEKLDLEIRARMISDDTLTAVTNSSYDNFEERCRRISQTTDTRITLISTNGKVLAETNQNRSQMENHANRPEVREAMNGSVGSSIRYSKTLQKNMMYVAVPIYIDNEVAAVLRTSMSISSIDHNLNDIYKNTALGTLLISLITAIICFFVARRITAPLEDLKKGAADVARGIFEARLPIPDIEEFGDLASSVNNMAEQLTDRLGEITEQNNERNAILSSMLEGVLAIDNNSQIISINKAAQRLFNTSKNEAKGKILQEIIRNTALHDFVDEIFLTADTVEKEFEFYNGGNKIIIAKGTILRDMNDKAMGALIVFNDITKIRQLENFRKDFVANVSHEIRTPLTVIMGSVEALLDGALENRVDAEHFMTTIARHSERLNNLVSDILDLSKIEQIEKGKELEMGIYSVDKLIETVTDLCRVNAKKKQIELQVLEYDKQLKVSMNHQMIEQALVNLIANAVKYSEQEKCIEIEVTTNKTSLIIAVKDNGYGIPPSHLSRLFERFYRVDKARTRQEGGTGLGLAIVKHIVQVHNGEVKAESEFGSGSTFSLIIPL